jgi:hypothetical protein
MGPPSIGFAMLPAGSLPSRERGPSVYCGYNLPDISEIDYTFFEDDIKKGEIAMLFHVVMTHTAENCPAKHPEKMPDVISSIEKLEEVGRLVKVKAHSLVWDPPEHMAFAVLEADTLGAVGRYLNSIAINQDFKITPVDQASDFIVMGKAIIAAQAEMVE